MSQRAMLDSKNHHSAVPLPCSTTTGLMKIKTRTSKNPQDNNEVASPSRPSGTPSSRSTAGRYRGRHAQRRAGGATNAEMKCVNTRDFNAAAKALVRVRGTPE